MTARRSSRKTRVTDDAETRARNQWNAFVRGWKDGAGMRERDVNFDEHDNPDIRDAYHNGRVGGDYDRRQSEQRATCTYSYDPISSEPSRKTRAEKP